MVDPEIVRALADSCLTAANQVAVEYVFRKSMRISENDRQLSLELSQGCDITAPRKKLITEAFVAVAEKYAILGQYFPEIALIGGLSTWAAQFSHVVRRLGELENQMDSKRPKTT